jgi:hypothetical protein
VPHNSVLRVDFLDYNAVVNQRVKLPDFGIYFRTKNQNPIDFVCRETPNLLHDMVFLRSYLHDATFEMSEVNIKGKVLRITMQRDRWELLKAHGQLESIATQLIISPVLSLKWKSKSKVVGKQVSGSSRRFFIRDVYLSESFWEQSDRAEIVLSGFGKKPPQLRIVVREPFSIRLQDITAKK